MSVSRLAGDTRGNTLIEFALIAPTMMLVIMGLGDLLYRAYAQSILSGAIQKAARDSAIQGGGQQTAAIDAKVRDMMREISNNAVMDPPTRSSYSNYKNVKPEDFTDGNRNGIRDPGECFTDTNDNGVWDANGNSGQGGANDTTMYTVTIKYPRLFPIMSLVGGDPIQTITAKTILKNQPYATQNIPIPETVCT